MNRRGLLLAVTIGTTGLAGCLASSTTGHLTGREVDQTPPSAELIPASDARIADIEAIQAVVRRAIARDGELVTVVITGREATRTIEQLKELPLYENESSLHRPGYYLEHDGHVVVMNCAVQQ